MPDAVKALGQDMQQKAPDELVGRKRHGAIACRAFAPIILEAEADAVVVERD
jgi:hypothetical protein